MGCSKHLKYILVNGYTSTGSSAVIDLLKEFQDICVPDYEFRLLKDPFGLIDLDHALNESTDMLNEDMAIRCFLWFADRYIRSTNWRNGLGVSYNQHYGKHIKELTDSYINRLTDYVYSGYWWYLDLHTSPSEYGLKRLLKKIGISDFRKKTKMRMSLKTEKEFLQITRRYIDSIFRNLIKEQGMVSCNTVVLDQAISPNHPEHASRYFTNYRNILVERDPRDVYIDLITEEKRNGDIVGHVGFDVAETHNVKLFIEWYKKSRESKHSQSDYLKLSFEDLILEYDKTSKRIFEYVGLKEEDHIKKGKYLKTQISKKNIGNWRDYAYQDEIRMIESALPQYLYRKKAE